MTATSSPALAIAQAIPLGFADPVRDAQIAFRGVLDAMSHPGKLVTLGIALDPPPPLMPATAALCLTLADFETPLWLDGHAAVSEVASYLRFHCGAPLVSSPQEARFAVLPGGDALPSLECFDRGTEELPERSATLLIQVDDLRNEGGMRLTGPGIADHRRLAVRGVAAQFWQEWRLNHALFPRGVDVVFIAGSCIAALPRTTHVEG